MFFILFHLCLTKKNFCVRIQMFNIELFNFALSNRADCLPKNKEEFMYNILENIFISKELYQTIFDPVCSKYKLNHTEIVVLMFLKNNPGYDTAKDIVERRGFTKSSVSMAVRSLQDRGLIKGEYINGNHRSIHLKLCPLSEEIINDGLKAQEKFFSILTDGFSESEKEILKGCYLKVAKNISLYNQNH